MGPGVHEDGFGLYRSDEVDSPAGFAAWVSRLIDQSDPTKPLEISRVHCTYRWIIEGDRVLGGIALRHASSDYVLWAGYPRSGWSSTCGDDAARTRGGAAWMPRIRNLFAWGGDIGWRLPRHRVGPAHP